MAANLTTKGFCFHTVGQQITFHFKVTPLLLQSAVLSTELPVDIPPLSSNEINVSQ